MARLEQVDIAPLRPERFQSILTSDQYEEFQDAIEFGQELFRGRVVWNVNSTARGGGVAEMLRSLLAYARGAGVDTRWVVIEGNPDFFRVTKRIHNHLHGSPGDGGPLGSAERDIYDDALRDNAQELSSLVRDEDVVILHDPQTAGLIPALLGKVETVIWRCHVGLDFPNELARGAWQFLLPDVSQANAYIFSREAFAWEGLDEERVWIIPPSIDAFSPKNQDMAPETVEAILGATGIIERDSSAHATFFRVDGTPGRVDAPTEFYDGGPPPPADAPLVVQVSRWDRLKDPDGVVRGFADHIARATDAHLVLAGPNVAAVADDPEGKGVLDESRALWASLPPDVQARIHLATLPMQDGEENAAIVNALQRRANVVVQKSLAEGFGLTVAEGMWKARPVVASRIGGIQDQIEHGDSGLLIDDPRDLDAYGRAVVDLLEDPREAERMGDRAQARVRNHFLGPRHLMQYLELTTPLVS